MKQYVITRKAETERERRLYGERVVYTTAYTPQQRRDAELNCVHRHSLLCESAVREADSI